MIIFDNKCQEILQEMGSSVAVISIYIHHIMVQTRGYSKHINTSRTDFECDLHVYLPKHCLLNCLL